MTKSFNVKALGAFKKLGAVALITAATLALAGLSTSCKQTPTPTPKHEVAFGVEGGQSQGGQSGQGTAGGTLKAKADGIAETEKSPITIEQGKVITFKAEAKAGYRVKGWTLDGKPITEAGTNTEYKLKVSKPATVKVSFEAIPPTKYTVTLTQTEHGKVTASPEIPEDKQVAEDTEITFTAKADDGYKVDKWTVTPAEALQAGGADESLTAKVKITADTTVSVSFVLTYAAAFSVEGSGGTLKAKAEGEAETETSPINVEKDKTVTFTATPNTDYMVDTWTVTPSAALQEGGTEGSTTAKVKITEATTVKVSFTKYKKVAYGTNGDDLKNCLTTASPASDGIYYIEVTGLKAEHLKGTYPNPGPLGQILKDNPTKKVALKLPKTVEGLTDMSSCFQQCTNLVQVRNIPDGVTNMNECFTECSSLTEAPAIPPSVQDITQCFANCSSLVKAPAILQGVTNMQSCFYDCTNLKEVPAIPDTVTNMLSCFEGCTSLTEAPVLPANVTNMLSCFANCTSLTEAPVLPANVTNIARCFANCTSLVEAPEIPQTVTQISSCFQNCGSLTKAPSAIPDTVTNMNECFQNCGSLTKPPAIPDGVTDMQRSFQNCGSLIEAPEIPQTVTRISSCFQGCGKIKSVVLKCNYRDGSFYDLFLNCASLEDGGIKVPQGQLQIYKGHADTMETKKEKFGVRVAYAELSAFLAGPNSSATDVNYIEVTGLTKEDLEELYNDSCKLGDKLKAYPAKKVALELPKEVEGLTDISFRACTSLVSVRNIPKSVRSMQKCFNGCTSLKYVSEVPSGITNMEECFSGCTALTKAPTIPSGITTMIQCFSGCTALTSVTLKCDYDPRNRSLKDAFQNCTALGEKSIKVPQAYYGNYTTAAALNTMAVPGADDEEKKAKFKGLAELNP